MKCERDPFLIEFWRRSPGVFVKGGILCIRVPIGRKIKRLL